MNDERREQKAYKTLAKANGELFESICVGVFTIVGNLKEEDYVEGISLVEQISTWNNLTLLISARIFYLLRADIYFGNEVKQTEEYFHQAKEEVFAMIDAQEEEGGKGEEGE